MKAGDKLQVVKHFGGLITLNFNPADTESKTHKVFTLGDAVEALKYLLLDDEGREINHE